MAQMRAPGLGSSLQPWNNHVTTDACRPMIGRSCVSLKERQEVEIETLHDYFMNSNSFFASIYLNPTGNILFHVQDDKNGNGRWDRPEPYHDSNYNWQYDPGESYTDLNNNNQWDEGEKGHGPSNQYRMALWEYEPVFTGLNHRKAVITPAHEAYELILKNLSAPKIRTVHQTCPTEDNCELVIGGRNISANTRVKIRSGNEGKFLSRYHSDQINRINSSIIRVKLNRKDAKALRAEGLTVELVRDDPWHYTMSNFCTLSPGIAHGTCN